MIWETETPSFLLRVAINFRSLCVGLIVMFSPMHCNVVHSNKRVKNYFRVVFKVLHAGNLECDIHRVQSAAFKEGKIWPGSGSLATSK